MISLRQAQTDKFGLMRQPLHSNRTNKSMRVSNSNKYHSTIVSIIIILAFLSGCTKEESSSPDVSGLLKTDTEISTIAFGSCAFQWNEQPIWKTISNAEPDLFLFIADSKNLAPAPGRWNVASTISCTNVA